MRKKIVFLVTFFSLVLMVLDGCVPSWEAVLINFSQQSLRVSIFQTGEDTPLRDFVLRPGESRKSQIALGKVVVSDQSAKELFHKTITLKDADDKYHRKGKRELRLLLTEHGAFPIPLNYWDSWRDHLHEILSTGQ